MSTALLLAIATASIVILLLLVIKAKVHPFVALLIVSLLVAIATGIPAEKIMETIITGMGGLLGHITIIIVLGAMLGAIIEASGGAESLAQRFSKTLGLKRTVAALTMAAFILGIPVFFEVGFIIVIPLIYGFTKVARVSPLKFGLPMAGVMLTVHVALPTHPGAAAAAGILHTDMGWLMILGIAPPRRSSSGLMITSWTWCCSIPHPATSQRVSGAFRPSLDGKRKQRRISIAP